MREKLLKCRHGWRKKYIWHVLHKSKPWEQTVKYCIDKTRFFIVQNIWKSGRHCFTEKVNVICWCIMSTDTMTILHTLYTGCYVVNTKWYEHKPLAFVENECIKLLYSSVIWSKNALLSKQLDHRYSGIKGNWERKRFRNVSRFEIYGNTCGGSRKSLFLWWCPWNSDVQNLKKKKLAG